MIRLTVCSLGVVFMIIIVVFLCRNYVVFVIIIVIFLSRDHKDTAQRNYQQQYYANPHISSTAISNYMGSARIC